MEKGIFIGNMQVNRNDNQAEMAEKIESKLVPKSMLFFDVEITEHCNLNCKGCDSLAPLADEEYLNIEECEKDLSRLSEISGGKVEHINILGGEPLMHPHVEEFLGLTRNYFPIGKIVIVTNGILLKSMKQKFWKICKENEIVLGVTRYPLQLDYDWIKNKAEKESVEFQWFGDDRKERWVHTKMDLSGQMNCKESFLHCWNANNCTVIEHGKLYPCPRAAKIRHFNKAFKTNMQVSEKDYLLIENIKSLDEIMLFLANPIPFCRFCCPESHYEESWGVSTKKMAEWM